jgi:hypothetical protein
MSKSTQACQGEKLVVLDYGRERLYRYTRAETSQGASRGVTCGAITTDKAESASITGSVRSTMVRDPGVPVRKSFSVFARIPVVYSLRFMNYSSRSRRSFIGPSWPLVNLVAESSSLKVE